MCAVFTIAILRGRILQMEGNDNQFFYENEVAVTKNIIRILRWLILAFPAIMIFSVAGLF